MVVSPHLDDGVLSLGAAMASWVRRGSRVELLTVFACDPESDVAAGGWDRRGGFRTEGESARARREEDRRACAILGATPVWLPYGNVDYERHGDEAEVRAAVAEAVTGADNVLLPGFPLSHPDHAWLVRLLVSGETPCNFSLQAGSLGGVRLGFYAEQPYSRRAGADPTAPDWLGTALTFEAVPAGSRDRLAKWLAIRRYRSQLPLLGMSRSLRRGPLALVRGDEEVAWVGDPGGPPH